MFVTSIEEPPELSIKLSKAKAMLTLAVPITDLEAVPARVKVAVPLPVTVKALRSISVPPLLVELELLQSLGHSGCLVIDKLPPPGLVIVIDTGKVLLVLPNLKLGANPVNDDVVDVEYELEELPLSVILGVPDI